jgi:DNA-binding transcriptional regulator GbsR (MarR family)
MSVVPAGDAGSENLPVPTGQDLVCDAIGGIIEFWGFKRVMGRIWALLYLSPRPLTAAEICSALSISAGTASMTLAELREWGVVLRAVVPGARTTHYAAETNVWKMVSKVFRERERDRFLELAARLREGSRLLGHESLSGGDLGELQRLQAERAEHLAQLAEQAAQLLAVLLDTSGVDLGPLFQALRSIE